MKNILILLLIAFLSYTGVYLTWEKKADQHRLRVLDDATIVSLLGLKRFAESYYIRHDFTYDGWCESLTRDRGQFKIASCISHEQGWELCAKVIETGSTFCTSRDGLIE